MGAISFKRSSLENFNKYNSLLVGNDATIPFDPADLNPDLWLDAADASTITESGGSVSQWDNKGTLENFSQGTSADQPTTGVSTVNGLNVIDFDNDFLQGSTASNWTFMHDGTDYFIAAVIQFTEDPGQRYNIAGNNLSSAGTGFQFFYRDDKSPGDALQYDVMKGSAGNFVVELREGNFLPTNTTYALSVFSDANATAADRVEYFRNDTQGTVDNSASNAPSSGNPSNTIQIGAITGADPLRGHIGEFIVVSGADATEAKRQEVVNYLNSKWGLF